MTTSNIDCPRCHRNEDACNCNYDQLWHCIREKDKRTSELEDQVTRMAAELAKYQTSGRILDQRGGVMDINQLWADEMNGKVPSGTFKAAMESQPRPFSATIQADMSKRISELEAALREIRDHMRCSECALDPSCASEMARKALESSARGENATTQ